MPLDKEKAVLLAAKTIKLGEKGRHKHYDRTVALADLYKKLITGEHIASLLHRFTPREDKEQFEQRVRLTQLVTPAIAEKIKSPFYKVSRIDNVNKKILFGADVTEDVARKRIDEIDIVIDDFYGDESLDDYMEQAFVDLSFSDPNAFIVVEFNEFDPRTEKPIPFPIQISSKEAINYKYVNNELQFLLVEKPINYSFTTSGGKKQLKDGSVFILYTENFSIKFTQFDGKEFALTESLNIEELTVNNTQSVRLGAKFFKVDYFEPKAGEIQAIRVGYKRDLETSNETYVNPFQPAMARMMKTIKSISELDLTTTLHVYPQKLQYVQACPGDVVNSETCRSGINRNGDKCSACKGEGVVIHKSTADSITLPLPKRSDEMLDLDKMLVYKNPSIELIKYQEEYVDKLEIKAMRDVFVSESFNRIIATKTATEKELDMESVYDTLLPFANKYSTVWKKIVRLCAKFTDNGEKITVVHSFPKDFKLKTIKALLTDLEQAETANAPSFIKAQIANDIADKMWSDNPEALNKFKVKQQHQPFGGKTQEEIIIGINQGDVTRFDRVFYGSFESIMNEIESEQLAKRTDFYKLPYDKRMQLIKAKVEQWIVLLDAERPTLDLGPGLEIEEVQ